MSLEDLQGLRPPEPELYEHRIYTHLKSQIDAGINPAIERELTPMEGESPEEALRSFAKYVSARIEGAQLCRNPAELEDLAGLTRLEVTELLRPANCSGHWLISAFGGGVDKAQIVPGAFGFWVHLDALVKEQLDCDGTDARISLRRDSPWYRIEIELPRRSKLPQTQRLIRIDIVRCQPDDKGIRWIPPSWTEDWLMTETLESWARQYGNFIQIFDAPLMPSNVTNLRLLVTEFEGSRDKRLGQAVIGLEMVSIPPNVKNEAVECGLSHALAIWHLQRELQAYLAPIIRSSPRGRWSLMTNYGGLSIDFWPRPIMTDSPYGLRYSIDLVEEIGPNEFRPSPWRGRDAKAFREIVDKWLN